MATKEEPPTPLGERVTAALIGTVALAYLVFLVLDIVNGWGLGWVVLGWIGAGFGSIVVIAIFISLWVWVWRGSGRYQMKNRQ